jgi:hypothetical protein
MGRIKMVHSSGAWILTEFVRFEIAKQSGLASSFKQIAELAPKIQPYIGCADWLPIPPMSRDMRFNGFKKKLLA